MSPSEKTKWGPPETEKPKVINSNLTEAYLERIAKALEALVDLKRNMG